MLRQLRRGLLLTDEGSTPVDGAARLPLVDHRAGRARGDGVTAPRGTAPPSTPSRRRRLESAWEPHRHEPSQPVHIPDGARPGDVDIPGGIERRKRLEDGVKLITTASPRPPMLWKYEVECETNKTVTIHLNFSDSRNIELVGEPANCFTVESKVAPFTARPSPCSASRPHDARTSASDVLLVRQRRGERRSTKAAVARPQHAVAHGDADRHAHDRHSPRRPGPACNGDLSFNTARCGRRANHGHRRNELDDRAPRRRRAHQRASSAGSSSARVNGEAVALGARARSSAACAAVDVGALRC